MSSQAFLPVMFVGCYSLLWGPNSIQLDQETNVAIHPILNGQDQTEPVGLTDPKLSLSGFVYSVDNQALLDMQRFTIPQNGTGFLNRPIAIGIFTQDSSDPLLSSQVWYTGVGYLSNLHFEMRGGYGVYKYPFRFNWIGAWPQVLIPAFDSGDHQTFTFTMTGQPTGYIAAVQLSTGGAINSVTAQSLAVINNVNSAIGTGPQLGSAANRLFAGNPLNLTSTLDWPVQDLAINQSIQTVSPTGTYKVFFNTPFGAPPIVKIVYIPL